MKFKKSFIASALTMLSLTSMVTGCSSGEKDYDLYIYNTKMEIADSIQELCKEYESETGTKVKVYTCGTSEAMETLRSEISSKDYPTLYSINQSQLLEWKEGGFALDSSNYTNDDLKNLHDSVPDTMRLKDEDGKSYGIPYNVEGYGLIADTRMINDVFGLESAETFIDDYRNATYEEFVALIESIDKYIDGNGGVEISLNGNKYTTATEKTELTENMNGVISIAGAEKWTYGNHYINYALNAVFPDYNSTYYATKEQVATLEEPLVKSLQELDMLSSYAAAQSGAVERGPEFINSTVTGYDQAVLAFAESKSMFIKQGNWIYSNIEQVDSEKAKNLTMLPMKVNFEQSDIVADGVTVEKLNTSIPEFISQYYVINAKATEEEQKVAQDFLVWLYTSDIGNDYVVNKFSFVPFNADSSVSLDNPLSNDLIYYMENNLVLGNNFDAYPESWGLNVIGSFIQEELFTNKETWSENTLREGVKKSLAVWEENVR